MIRRCHHIIIIISSSRVGVGRWYRRSSIIIIICWGSTIIITILYMIIITIVAVIIITMIRRYRWWRFCLIISSRHGCHQPVWITIPPRVRVQGTWLVSHSLVVVVGRLGMRTIILRCIEVVVVVLHRGIWQIIVIRSERAWWQPLSWSKRAWWQPLSCSIIVTRRHWDDRQCWRSRVNVKMLWWCTTQKWRIVVAFQRRWRQIFASPFYAMMG